MILIFKQGDRTIAAAAWSASAPIMGGDVTISYLLIRDSGPAWYSTTIRGLSWVAFEAVLPKAIAGVIDLRPLQ